MNEINSSADFQPQQARPAAPKADADLRAAIARLTQGDDALARRKDVGELHKRLVAMVTTLNQGLGEAQAAKAAEDRAQLVVRLDQMERAVNSMEGALRIELEPMLRRFVEDAIHGKPARQSGPVVRGMVQLLVIGLALVIGVAFAEDFRSVAVKAMAGLQSSGIATAIELPPSGGISGASNLLE